MRILIDFQGAQSGSKSRGIGRYTRSFVKSVLRNNKKHEIFIVLNQATSESIDEILSDLSGLIERDRIIVFPGLKPIAAVYLDCVPRSIASGVLRNYFFAKLKPDFILFTSVVEGFTDDVDTSIGPNLGIPYGVILYDLIPFLNPQQYLQSPECKKWYQEKIQIMKNADLLFAISCSAAKEAIEYLGFPEEKIKTIGSDTSSIFTKKQENSKGKNHDSPTIEGKFLLYVGIIDSGDPRKNSKALLEAYSLLPEYIQQSRKLVLVGKVNPIDKKKLLNLLSSKGISKSFVVFMGRLSDEDLVSLYRECELFIFPSLHEGFGLPVLEAMRCGAPVIASNTSSIPEVISCKEALFDPLRPSDIADKIVQALEPAFRRKLIQKGHAKCKEFSWDKTARLALEAIDCLPNQNKLRSSPSLEDCVEDLSKITGLKQHDFHFIAQALNQIESLTDPQQFFVDISLFVHGDLKTGIQRVIRNILKHMLDMITVRGFRIEPVYRDGSIYRYARHLTLEKKKSSQSFEGNDVINITPRDIFLALDLDVIRSQEAEDFLVSQKQRGMRLYTIMYDTIPYTHPEWVIKNGAPPLQAWLKRSLEISDGIICISKAVVDEVRKITIHQPPERYQPLQLGYFHLGADMDAQEVGKQLTHEEQSFLRQFEGKDYFLMVGTLEPRKGHAQVIDAMEHIWESNLNKSLVIVGAQGWSVESLIGRIKNHSEYGKRLVWIEKPVDAVVKSLYENAHAFIMASKAEGYGLPIIEAAHYGVPLILRDIPVFHEIAGSHAHYFSGMGGEELADSLRTWISLYQQGIHPSSEGMPHNSWKDSTEQLLEQVFQLENKYRMDSSKKSSSDLSQSHHVDILVNASHENEFEQGSDVQRRVNENH